MEIVHIAAHVGGGVGAVLHDFFKISARTEVANRILCLDVCKDRRALAAANFWEENCWVLNSNDFNDRVAACDVVVLHFWNHPLMSYVLHKWDITKKPSIVWSHNSGLHEPHIIPSYLGRIVSRVVFSSECSLKVPNKRELACSNRSERQVVHSSRSLDDFFTIQRQNLVISTARRAVYIGTVSFAKMHEQSIEIFKTLARNGLDVRVVGGGEHVQIFRERTGIAGRVEVVGPVEDVRSHLAWADIFVYPLRKDHYGTGEQVILEAMASGLPVVAFENPAERAIVSDRVTGRLVQNSQEFVATVVSLAEDDALREQMSIASRRRASQCFGAQRMVDGLLENVRGASGEKASGQIIDEFQVSDLGLYLFVRNSFHDEDLHKVVALKGASSAMQIFERIRPYLAILENIDRWTGAAKSTPNQYLSYFPDSEGLKILCGLIDEDIFLNYRVRQ